jgi:hypothetical protein
VTAARATAVRRDEREVLAWLAKTGSRGAVEGMARYGIPTSRP